MPERRIAVNMSFDRSPRRGVRGRRCSGRAELLELARNVAEEHALAQSLKLCTVDDVVAGLARRGFDPSALGSSLGNVFRTRDWQALPVRFTSHASRRRRSRQIRIRRLVGDVSSPFVQEASLSTMSFDEKRRAPSSYRRSTTRGCGTRGRLNGKRKARWTKAWRTPRYVVDLRVAFGRRHET